MKKSLTLDCLLSDTKELVIFLQRNRIEDLTNEMQKEFFMEDTALILRNLKLIEQLIRRNEVYQFLDNNEK